VLGSISSESSRLIPNKKGRHERMHLTLKQEATKPAAKNLLQQQQRFDRFLHIYNQERPHQAIGMKYSAEIYVSSSRPYKGLSDLEYLFHDRTITHSLRHCTALPNPMIFWMSIAGRHALQCVLTSAPELVTALNLHEMTNGFPHCSALGLVAQCNCVHWHKAASVRSPLFPHPCPLSPPISIWRWTLAPALVCVREIRPPLPTRTSR
jgi:hypothetical protein